MERATYDSLWSNSIMPIIDEMLSKNTDIYFVGGQVKEKIWLTYEDFKNRVHSYMQNPEGRIDRHKIASVMLYSIIVNKPLELKLMPVKRNVKSETLVANEILGFNTALAIVRSFILGEAEELADKQKIEIFRNGFVFPECTHDKYEATIFKMLYYAKLNKNYDIFAFAHILFLIEAYTEFVKKTELAGKILP